VSSARLQELARRLPWRKEFTLKDRVSALASAVPRTESAITGATTIMIVRASTRKGDITEVPQVYERHPYRWRDRDWD
jgi:hypothetical protein